MQKLVIAVLIFAIAMLFTEGAIQHAAAGQPDSTGGIFLDKDEQPPKQETGRADCIAQYGVADISCKSGFGHNCGWAKVSQICNWYSSTDKYCCKDSSQLDEAKAEAKRKACAKATSTCDSMNLARRCYYTRTTRYAYCDNERK